MLKKILLATTLLTTPVYADSYNINISTPYKELSEGITVKNGIAYLYGEITNGYAQKFSRIPRDVTKLIITSPGGLVDEGEQIAMEVKNRNMSTIAIGYCYSACTVIFAAGNQRIAKHDVKFLIHSTKLICFNRNDSCSYSQEEIRITEQENRKLISYYDRFGVDGNFTRSAVRWPQKQNEKMFDPNVAKEINLATHIMPDKATYTLLNFFDSRIDPEQFRKIPKPITISLR